MHIHMTLKSSNRKVGPIPVSTTTKDTCPDACPFKGNGCYAEGGPLAIHWKKVTAGQAGGSFEVFLDTVADLPDGQLWRHNQAGDLPGDRKRLDREKCERLTKANEGKRGFTYCHYDVVDDVHNRETLAAMNAGGFTVNASANSLDHADVVAATGLPTVTVLPIEYETQRETFTPEGRRVVVCPVVTGQADSCATCQLCQRRDRKVIVGFPAHGVSKRKADAVAA